MRLDNYVTILFKLNELSTHHQIIIITRDLSKWPKWKRTAKNTLANILVRNSFGRKDKYHALQTMRRSIVPLYARQSLAYHRRHNGCFNLCDWLYASEHNRFEMHEMHSAHAQTFIACGLDCVKKTRIEGNADNNAKVANHFEGRRKWYGHRAKQSATKFRR